MRSVVCVEGSPRSSGVDGRVDGQKKGLAGAGCRWRCSSWPRLPSAKLSSGGFVNSGWSVEPPPDLPGVRPIRPIPKMPNVPRPIRADQQPAAVHSLPFHVAHSTPRLPWQHVVPPPEQEHGLPRRWDRLTGIGCAHTQQFHAPVQLSKINGSCHRQGHEIAADTFRAGAHPFRNAESVSVTQNTATHPIYLLTLQQSPSGGPDVIRRGLRTASNSPIPARRWFAFQQNAAGSENSGLIRHGRCVTRYPITNAVSIFRQNTTKTRCPCAAHPHAGKDHACACEGKTAIITGFSARNSGEGTPRAFAREGAAAGGQRIETRKYGARVVSEIVRPRRNLPCLLKADVHESCRGPRGSSTKCPLPAHAVSEILVNMPGSQSQAKNPCWRSDENELDRQSSPSTVKGLVPHANAAISRYHAQAVRLAPFPSNMPSDRCGAAHTPRPETWYNALKGRSEPTRSPNPWRLNWPKIITASNAVNARWLRNPAGCQHFGRRHRRRTARAFASDGPTGPGFSDTNKVFRQRRALLCVQRSLPDTGVCKMEIRVRSAVSACLRILPRRAPHSLLRNEG